MQLRYTLAASDVLAVPVHAADIKLNLDIPRLDVAEYHRPYVAMWLEKPDQSFVANLAVWYDLKLKDKEGNKWLKDMRQWWRKSGRNLEMPVDGISGATRAPGKHSIHFSDAKAPLKSLPPGEYQLVVEAAREVGGRELVRIPLQWPPQQPITLKETGSHELGQITIEMTP